MAAPDLPLSFSTEPVTGWRLWRVTREVDQRRSALDLAEELLDAERRGDEGPVARLFEPRLRSLTQMDFWPAGRRVRAACDVGHPPEASPPSVHCECGIWSYRNFDQAHESLLDHADAGWTIAFGPVWLWGRIVEHFGGYRAQYAYPRELTVYGAQPDLAEALRRSYRVPARAAEWPAPRMPARGR